MNKIRVSAINFLNPAPLLYDFEHSLMAEQLARRYEVHYTVPSQCARELASGEADLGLIPVAALSTTPELAIVPGCVIASPGAVRSILLVSKKPLEEVGQVAADSSSLSSVAYTQILFRHFLQIEPGFETHPPDLAAMLQVADAALLIGDPALIVNENRAFWEETAGCPLFWFDLAEEWVRRTGLPWVAAVWAVRPQALVGNEFQARTLIADLVASRDHGMANVEALVQEWTPRLPVSAKTIYTYLTQNIRYTLTPACIEAIQLFQKLAAEVNVLPPAEQLHFLA